MRAAILIGLICAVPAGAQVVSPMAKQSPYAVDQWNTDAGLPQNSVNTILQSRDGHLWLGTLGGVARFDGTAFLSITTGDFPELRSDRVLALSEDAAGRIWIGTEAGLSRYDHGRIKTFTTKQALPGGMVRTLAADSAGRVWFGMSSGAVGRAENDSFHVFVSPAGRLGTDIQRIVVSGPTIWVSTDSALFRLDSTGAATLVHRAERHNSQERAIVADPHGGIWEATDSSLVRRTELTSTVYRLPAVAHTTMPDIRSLATVDGKVIWMGTFGAQIWRFSVDSNLLEQVKGAEQGVSTDIVVDREGSVWLGNRVTGLTRVRRSLFQTYTTADGLANNNAASVFVDSRGRIWAGSRCSGASLREGGQFRPIGKGEAPHCVSTIAEASPGEIWMGGSGIGRWRDGRYEALDSRPNAPLVDVRAIFRAHDGMLWIGSKEGITTWNGTTFSRLPRLERTGPGAVYPYNVHQFYEQRGGVMCIATDHGAFCSPQGRFTLLKSETGLPYEADVRGMYQDSSGAMWLATYGGGLARASGSVITTYTTADGLLDNYLSSVTEDRAGNLWLSGNRGIFRVARRETESYDATRRTRLHVVSYGRADGLRSSEANGGFQPAFAWAADGHLWYPTLVGVTTIDPAANAGSVAPRVSLDRLVADGRANDPDNGLSIGPGAADVQIDYSGLSLSAPNAVIFRYRLDNWDKDWIEVGTRRNASYSHLSPGTYRFGVMAANRDGVWSADTASVSFTVRPFIWQTWWFRSLAGLAIAMIPIVLVGRSRARQAELTRMVEAKTVELRHQKDEIAEQAKALEKQNEILAENVRLKDDVERISRHDLRTPLTSIISLAQIVREDGRLPSEHDASLQLIEQAGYRVLNMANLTLDLFKMEQKTYRLTPRPIDIRAVVDRVLLDLQAVLRTKEVTCDVTGEAPTNDPVLVRGDELLSYSMLSNIVKNAIEASPPRGRVSISIVSRARIEISIHNDGSVPIALRDRFFEKYATEGKTGGTGLGAYSARLMAETQGGSIRVDTADATGTTVVVDMLRAERTESGETTQAIRGGSSTARDVMTGPRAILIVDDDENTRAIVHHFLTRDGWTVDEAENGPLALRMFEESHFDCVFMDIEMPVMGGLDVVGRMRAIEQDRQAGHTTIVALSSHDDGATQDRAIAAGFDKYLIKPASRQRLIGMVTGEQASEGIEVPANPAGLSITLDPDLRHLLPSFIERKIIEASSLADGVLRRDADDVRRLSHKMRGSLSLYGFSAASRTCAEIEAMSEAQAFDGIAKRLPELREQLADIERLVARMNVLEV